MKFNFKIQQYQTDAVDSVVNCFNGQPYIDNVSYRRDIGNVRQMKDMSQIDLKFASEQNAFGLTDDFDDLYIPKKASRLQTAGFYLY